MWKFLKVEMKDVWTGMEGWALGIMNLKEKNVLFLNDSIFNCRPSGILKTGWNQRRNCKGADT